MKFQTPPLIILTLPFTCFPLPVPTTMPPKRSQQSNKRKATGRADPSPARKPRQASNPSTPSGRSTRSNSNTGTPKNLGITMNEPKSNDSQAAKDRSSRVKNRAAIRDQDPQPRKKKKKQPTLPPIEEVAANDRDPSHPLAPLPAGSPQMALAANMIAKVSRIASSAMSSSFPD